MNNIISNCLLCEERSLHVIEQGETKLMQCINCGYTSSDKFLGTKASLEWFDDACLLSTISSFVVSNAISWISIILSQQWVKNDFVPLKHIPTTILLFCLHFL